MALPTQCAPASRLSKSALLSTFVYAYTPVLTPQVECDLTSDERAEALTEMPWTCAATTAQLPSLEADGRRLTGDGVDEIPKRCSPSALLWLKGVSSSWCDCVRGILCEAVWAQQCGLTADWAEGARTLMEHRGSGFTEYLTQNRLSFSHKQIDEIEAGGVAAVVVFSAVLTDLNLEKSGICPEGATAIGKALMVNPVLTSLSLGINSDMGPKGTNSICEALKVNTMLLNLSLRFNSIRDQGAIALGTALELTWRSRS